TSTPRAGTPAPANAWRAPSTRRLVMGSLKRAAMTAKRRPPGPGPPAGASAGRLLGARPAISRPEEGRRPASGGWPGAPPAPAALPGPRSLGRRDQHAHGGRAHSG